MTQNNLEQLHAFKDMKESLNVIAHELKVLNSSIEQFMHVVISMFQLSTSSNPDPYKINKYGK